MSDFRHTCTIKCGHEVNGLSQTAYEIADEYQIDCKIDREVIKTGWFSKRYEYHITFSGDKEKVTKAIDDMSDRAEKYNKRIHGQQETECDSWW